jgi:hypothetical protein
MSQARSNARLQEPFPRAVRAVGYCAELHLLCGRVYAQHRAAGTALMTRRALVTRRAPSHLQHRTLRQFQAHLCLNIYKDTIGLTVHQSGICFTGHWRGGAPIIHLVISKARPLELTSGVWLRERGAPEVTDGGDPAEPCATSSGRQVEVLGVPSNTFLQ